ncbi:MAG: hypothetical protein AMJ93_09580 [Anaerolineae bacterium SM23_84]|nr:MAG: hypothetical protein AMJ93_09580 [Anaerolineae bacterium SM23_84]
MPGLEIGNDRILMRVERDARFSFCTMPYGAFEDGLDLQEGTVAVNGLGRISGLVYYAMPCRFESLEVRLEGVSTPIVSRAVGNWPVDVEDDELETYPYLHFLEERGTGMPWRWERWYTLAGRHLVFDSEQYFERARPELRGKNWERFMVRLRQAVDLAEWAQNQEVAFTNLISTAGLEGR